MLCLCLSGGLQAGIRKSNLKVLYVGGSPDVDYVGNRPDSAVLAQSSAKRMASFDKMLKRYFRQVTVIRAQAYRPELSDNYDVTVMDGRPAPILPGIMERDRFCEKRGSDSDYRDVADPSGNRVWLYKSKTGRRRCGIRSKSNQGGGRI